MELLDQANERVDGLLRSIDITVTSGQSELFPTTDTAVSEHPADPVSDLRTVDSDADESTPIE